MKARINAGLPLFLLAAPSFAAITFHRDVEPILQAHCQSCHRPGEIGPMPLLTFADTRKWSAAIKEAIALKRMPPWYADPAANQHYKNDSSLSPADAATIRDWIAAGSPEGSPKDAPPPRPFTEGWGIGAPDMVVDLPEYQIPANGAGEYTYVILPTRFTKDTWVSASEIRPGNRALMHHSFLFVRTPGSKWFAGYPVGRYFVPDARPGTEKRNSDGDRTAEGSRADEQLAGYVPGEEPTALPPDTAILVKAGSDFVLQVHYTTNGKSGSDKTRIGLVFAKKPPAQRAFFEGVSGSRFVIPPGDPNYSSTASITLATDVHLLAAGPHMHLRGKAMEMRAFYPSGESETLFSVPRYDFNWQQLYEFPSPKLLPKGTRVEIRAVFDNSRNNPFNPDPEASVRFGEQSWQEMMIGFVTLQISPDADLDNLFEHRRKPPVPPEAAPLKP